jgi:PAS domain S-box-containing protein
LDVWESRVHPEAHQSVLAEYSEFLKSGFEWIESKYPIRKKSGEYIWVQNRVCVVEYFASGELKRVMGTMLNISEHKRIELDQLHAKDRAEAGDAAPNRCPAEL